MVYGPPEVPEHGGVAAEHVVVGRQVRVAEVGHGLPDGADGTAVAAHFGLGKDDADVHVASLPAPAPRLHPASPSACRADPPAPGQRRLT